MNPARIVILLYLVLCGCAGSKVEMPVQIAQPQHCEALYVILPGNFVIDVAAGSRVALNPAIQEFAVFCSVQDAQQALRDEADKSGLKMEDWRVYRLDGSFEELASPGENGRHRLIKQADIADWEE